MTNELYILFQAAVGLGIVFGAFGIVGFIGWLVDDYFPQRRYDKEQEMRNHYRYHQESKFNYCDICGIKLN